jgi:hypothetical protein
VSDPSGGVFVFHTKGMQFEFTDKDIYSVYFRDLVIEDGNPKWMDDIQQVICQCQKVLKKQSNGFTNAANHVKSQHKEEYESKVQEYLQLKAKGQKSVLDFVSIPQNAMNMYKWLDWVVMDNHSFHFVEKKRTRGNSKLTPVATTTFMKYLRLVTTKVEAIVKNTLPPKFGLILDGWTENSTHFCVLFACIPGTCERVMLSFSPLLDQRTQDANAHYNWIVAMLAPYGKTPESILFFCSDNTNTMPAVARLLNCHFLGCNSHRLALYVKHYLDCDEEDDAHILNKLKKLMKKLRSANKAGALMMETHLKPITSNATRWSSTYNMVRRYNLGTKI